ncbi:SUMO deconjugating enzyme Ulp1 [Schizosaccharomyces octosporus yFS286]|uniref:SUMO deconjugating enzyme Ulp1 n=1 Tax=Schizosaccharomyces octosporus (strain yFS286) TaxID=483514 RepID=S9PTU9_SCHOY|nr:SUMO deconjugating enzyme Ulp1 [Schizosaccharomyces octosporus yFS286]EPX72551.1 SUMO deconjugating enzyme Ulp1 [Schizosaccharomyces octosporus yFS286]
MIRERNATKRSHPDDAASLEEYKKRKKTIFNTFVGICSRTVTYAKVLLTGTPMTGMDSTAGNTNSSLSGESATHSSGTTEAQGTIDDQSLASFSTSVKEKNIKTERKLRLQNPPEIINSISTQRFFHSSNHNSATAANGLLEPSPQSFRASRLQYIPRPHQPSRRLSTSDRLKLAVSQDTAEIMVPSGLSPFRRVENEGLVTLQEPSSNLSAKDYTSVPPVEPEQASLLKLHESKFVTPSSQIHDAKMQIRSSHLPFTATMRRSIDKNSTPWRPPPRLVSTDLHPRPSNFPLSSDVDNENSLLQLIQKLKEKQTEAFHDWNEIDFLQLKGLHVTPPPVRPKFVSLLEFPKEARERALHLLNDNDLPRSSYTEPIITKYNIPIMLRDLRTLKSRQWLNDEVINFYMNLLSDRSRSDSSLPRVHVFNTFFYTTLQKKGYAGVRRWARRASMKIADFDCVLVPVHLDVHWCMAAINKKKKRFEYWDSLAGSPGKVFDLLKEYYVAETKGAVDITDWENYIDHNSPRQQNGYDCGVFACKTAECLAREVPLHFSQKDMPELRLRMAASIIDSRIY